jgi:hypothetical protein
VTAYESREDLGVPLLVATTRERKSMTTMLTHTWTELAHRASADVEVTLFWVQGDIEDKAVVCVRDRCEGVCFEIPTNAYLALEVYYHPFAYRDFSTVTYEEIRLAA